MCSYFVLNVPRETKNVPVSTKFGTPRVAETHTSGVWIGLLSRRSRRPRYQGLVLFHDLVESTKREIARTPNFSPKQNRTVPKKIWTSNRVPSNWMSQSLSEGQIMKPRKERRGGPNPNHPSKLRRISRMYQRLPCTKSLHYKIILKNCQMYNIKTREKCINLHAFKLRVKINKQITRTRTWHEYREIINVVISPPWLICVVEWSKYVPLCRGLEDFLQRLPTATAPIVLLHVLNLIGSRF